MNYNTNIELGHQYFVSIGKRAIPKLMSIGNKKTRFLRQQSLVVFFFFVAGAVLESSSHYIVYVIPSVNKPVRVGDRDFKGETPVVEAVSAAALTQGLV